MPGEEGLLNAGVTVFDCKLDDLLPKPSKRVKDGVQSAELVLVTSQEIDELCEADNIAQARLQMDGVLGNLRRGVRCHTCSVAIRACRSVSRAFVRPDEANKAQSLEKGVRDAGSWNVARRYA